MVTLCESVGLVACYVCEEYFDAGDINKKGVCAECQKLVDRMDDDRPERRRRFEMERADPGEFDKAERAYNEYAWRQWFESNGRRGWPEPEWQHIRVIVNGRSLMWQA